MTRRISTRRSSKRRSSKRLRANVPKHPDAIPDGVGLVEVLWRSQGECLVYAVLPDRTMLETKKSFRSQRLGDGEVVRARAIAAGVQMAKEMVLSGLAPAAWVRYTDKRLIGANEERIVARVGVVPSNRLSSKRLRANSVSRSHLKSYPKNKGYEDATWKWALTAFPLEKRRIVVTAWRAREGVGKDRGLEQVFDGDAKGLRAAMAYARSLIADKVAVVADVKGEVYLDGYWPKPWGGTWSYEWVSVEDLASLED